MRKLPYDNFNSESFIVRDWLALDRTVLANERTFLAYGRTALGLMVTGLTMIKLFHSSLAIVSGWGFVATAAAVFAYGVRRFVRMQGHYRALASIDEVVLPANLDKDLRLSPPQGALERDPA